jgi:hypothetical protein
MDPRRTNASAVRASETMFAEMAKQQEATSQRRQRQAQQDEALALELERRKREEDSKRREIQRICEADPELRALQDKLKVCGGGLSGLRSVTTGVSSFLLFWLPLP